MILCNEKLLLTRPNYGHRLWTVPGGAVEKNETYEDGARREIMEELGIEIAELTMRGGYEMIFDYKEFTVKTFIAHVKTEACVIDRIEVKEAHWFQLSELPWDRTPRVDELIRLI